MKRGVALIAAPAIGVALMGAAVLAGGANADGPIPPQAARTVQQSEQPVAPPAPAQATPAQPTEQPDPADAADADTAAAEAATTAAAAEAKKTRRKAKYSRCVAKLPLDVRVGQTMLIITPNPWLVSSTIKAGRAAGLLAWGNLSRSGADGFRKVASGTKYGAILAADEEGGLVQRYRGVTSLVPSARWQAQTMSPKQVRALYRAHGEELKKWGVDMALAPVVDVGHGPGITSRAYSGSPTVVAKYAGAAAQGYRDAGLLPVLKHFPGHGRGSADSHTSYSTAPGIQSLRQVDLKPYATLLDDGPVGVLVAHVKVPGYSDGPSSLSRKVIRTLLRKEYGHDGLVISDGLGMAGTGTYQGTGLVRFLKAGGDLGIVTAGGAPYARDAVTRAVADGTLSEKRINTVAERVLRYKGIKACGLLKD